jgi:hypothetical protein
MGEMGRVGVVKLPGVLEAEAQVDRVVVRCLGDCLVAEQVV